MEQFWVKYIYIIVCIIKASQLKDKSSYTSSLYVIPSLREIYISGVLYLSLLCLWLYAICLQVPFKRVPLIKSFHPVIVLWVSLYPEILTTTPASQPLFWMSNHSKLYLIFFLNNNNICFGDILVCTNTTETQMSPPCVLHINSRLYREIPVFLHNKKWIIVNHKKAPPAVTEK